MAFSINFPYKSGIFIYICLCQEQILTYHYLPKFKCILEFFSWCCMFRGFRWSRLFNTWSYTVLQFSSVQFSLVQSLSHVRLFATPWIAQREASLSITNSQSSLRLTSIESVMAISSSVIPFSSCPQSLPASESFPMSQLFAWGGQSIGDSALASVLPMNTQDWSPLEWTGWISLQSKGLSRIFCNTTVQKHQLFGAQLSSQSKSHIHTWPQEKQSLD